MDKLYITGKLNDTIEVSNQYNVGRITIPKNSWIIGVLRPYNKEKDNAYENCEIIAWVEEVPKHGYKYDCYVPINIVETCSNYEIMMYYTLPSIDHIKIYKEGVSIEEILADLSSNVLESSFDQEIADLEV